MEEEDWLDRYYDRELKYNEKNQFKHKIDQNRCIAITCDQSRLKRLDAQVALMTAANLFGRMSRNVVLAFDDVEMHPNLPWSNGSIQKFILNNMKQAVRFGRYTIRKPHKDDFCIHFGETGEGFMFDGMGWNSYIGSVPSGLPTLPDGNIFGAAFSGILAAAQFYRSPFKEITKKYSCNTLNWSTDSSLEQNNFGDKEIGEIYFIGQGSVGSAALYYLTLHSRKFSPTLIDKKEVKIHNLSRSPIFLSADCIDDNDYSNKDKFKVDSAARFLANAGVKVSEVFRGELCNYSPWINRRPNGPDILVSAANENDVRRLIEHKLPPIQIYATTGTMWDITLLRHMPKDSACSMCCFPPDEQKVQQKCATESLNVKESNKRIDAALPFLSFGAGLMTASEIAKLCLPNYPFTENQVFLYLYDSPDFSPTSIGCNPNCECKSIDSESHIKFVENSKYSHL